jgi:hypothetical protein
MTELRPNPRNCSTCEWASGEAFCGAPVPLWVHIEAKRIVPDVSKRCDAHKVKKGTFARICLNCGHPIRTHHKYSNLGQDQWIHKYCDHPESWSKYHHEKYGH